MKRLRHRPLTRELMLVIVVKLGAVVPAGDHGSDLHDDRQADPKGYGEVLGHAVRHQLGLLLALRRRQLRCAHLDPGSLGTGRYPFERTAA